jgi:hypothetical protein
MELPQPFRTAKRRLRHKQTAAAVPPPGPVTIVAVQRVDASHVYWKFSSPVVGPDEVTGLIVGGQNPSDLEITGEGWLLIGYDDPIAVGNPWEVSGDVALTFESGTELEIPESGMVTS